MRVTSLCLYGLLILITATTIGCGDDPGPDVPVDGAITVNPEPNSINATWQMTGPNGFTKSAAGDAVLTDMTAGSYTLTWGAVSGWTAPSPAAATQVLAEGGAVTFAGTYVTQALPGTITINPEPNSISAPWQLTGPNAFSQSGTGYTTLIDRAAGSYTLTWGAVAGWTTPSPAAVTQTLVVGGAVAFSGRYANDPVVPVEVVSIPAGTFMMGSPTTEVEHDSRGDETQHQVTLTHSFYMQATEVTNQQYRDLAQWAYDNGYVTATTSGLYDKLDGSTRLLSTLGAGDYELSFSGGVFSCINPTHPVKYVTWYGSAACCDWLSLQQGLTRAYDHGTWQCNGGSPYTAAGYRLPTEAEWEYACRAGTQAPFNTGSCLDAGTEANYNGLGPYPGCSTGPYVGGTVPVRSYPANAFGLYDMHGSLWEWCNDWYGTYGGTVTDPVGAGAGSSRVNRGGGWLNSAQGCRSAFRDYYDPVSSFNDIGFRPVYPPERTAAGVGPKVRHP
jgi:formylglycine-generating enzyme required for sulfatase activity